MFVSVHLFPFCLLQQLRKLHLVKNSLVLLVHPVASAVFCLVVKSNLRCVYRSVCICLFIRLGMQVVESWLTTMISAACAVIKSSIFKCSMFFYLNRVIQLRTRKSCTRRLRRVLCASAAVPWPWTLTFWPKNVIRSSVSQDAPVTKVWWKSVNRYWRYRGNIKLPSESRTDARTDSGTDGRPENIASAGAYRRRRLKKPTALNCFIPATDMCHQYEKYNVATQRQPLFFPPVNCHFIG